MAHPNDNRPDPLKPTAVTNTPTDPQAASTPQAPKGTGTQPDMKQRDTKGDPDATKAPGAQRNDRNPDATSGTPADQADTESDQAEDTAQANVLDDRRDHASEREEDVKGHKVGDERPEHTTRAND